MSSPSTASFVSRPSTSCARVDFLRVLPLAVSVSIVAYLPLPSLASCTAVNALCFVLCQHDRVWKALCAARWRPLQHARTLLTQAEWTALYGEEDEEREEGRSEEEDGERSADTARSATPGPVAMPGACSTGGAKDAPVVDSATVASSWKERYIACEMDLCRSFISLEEVVCTKWAFRFLPNVFFDNSQTSYPVFTPARLITGLDMTYEWRFVDSERAMPAVCRERGEMSAYERARLVSAERIGRVRSASRPYWLRSSGTALEPPIAAPRADEAEQWSGAPPPQPHAASALSSPALPPFRFLPGHPFFRLSAQQLADIARERKLQVSHFPALAVSRLPDGGWQLLNQYVLFRSVQPGADSHSNTQHAEDDEQEEGDSGEEDDEDEQEEGSGEEEGAEGEEEEQEQEEDGAGMEVAAEENGDDDVSGGAAGRVPVAVQTGRLRHLHRLRSSANHDDQHMHDSDASHSNA